MRLTAALATLSAVLLTATGCSNDDDSEPSSASAPETASTSTSAAPTFVQSQTCRDEMSPIVDVMMANSVSSLGFDEFEARYDRIDKELDQALTACQGRVEEFARQVMYQYALANAAWTFCNNGTVSPCVESKISKPLRKGQDFVDKLADAIAETT